MTASNAYPLADRLILFRYFNRLFGAERFEDLQALLRHQSEGYDAAGGSHFFNALKGQARVAEDRLARYDANLRQDVAAMNAGRPLPIQLKYFQYLAALYTEIFLDWRANRPAAFLSELNEFVREQNRLTPYYAQYKPFARRDMDKIAYWMATGSGKTLLLHINYRQFLRYQPDPGQNLLLITPPGDLLTQQHLDELRLSGVPCITYAEDAPIGLPNPVRVIEISKLTENKSGEGVTIDVEAFEGQNLLFVDEGHKGSGGEAWKGLRDRLGSDGFTFEYSATFGQAMHGAHNPGLLEEYSKAILFDYSYKYFHGDGYGKEYQVLNLREDRADDLTDTLLLANLLAFYEQARIFAEHSAEIRPYNLEAPLWVFIGSSVNAVYTEERQKKSDVLRVVLFLARVLRERNWGQRTVAKIMQGSAELKDPEGRDLFVGRFGYLRELRLSPAQLFTDLLQAFFHTRSAGSLRLARIQNAEGEIGLKAGDASDYFGLINIGDTAAFLKLVEEERTLTREDDAFSPALFDSISQPASRIQVLIGSKKFIEGWSSWRVSTMGLLNIGRAEGTQIIQLFGRGVRLLGKGRSLQRSAFLPGRHPPFLPVLETLNIFGVRANYMSEFRNYLDREGVPSGGYEEIEVPIRTDAGLLRRHLVVPRPDPNADFTTQHLTLPASLPSPPRLDLRPQVAVVSSVQASGGSVGEADAPRSFSPQVLALLDWDCLYLDVLEFRRTHGWHNLVIARETLRTILEHRQYTLYAPDSDVTPRCYADLVRVQVAARAVLEKYVEQYYHAERYRFASRQLAYHRLDAQDDNFSFGAYRIKVPLQQHDLIRRIHEVVDDAARLFERENAGLPRVHFDRHLYQPLLTRLEGVTVSPPALEEHERAFVSRLRDWLADHPQALKGRDIFLLRNQSRGRGIGFFEDAGFYPDFALWVKQGKRQQLVFVDPHGMLLDSDPKDEKVQLHLRLKEVEKRLARPDVSLDSYLISTTDFATLTARAAWRGYTRAEFARLHVLFEDDDVGTLL